MLRALTAISLCLLCNSVFSATIKLSCNVSVTDTFSSGSVEKSNGRLVLQVEILNGVTIISGTGAGLDIAVTTKKVGRIIEVQDMSDSGKWDISNQVQRKNGSTGTNQIFIDRNTGDFHFSRLVDNGMSSHASGTCHKVDTATRKF